MSFKCCSLAIFQKDVLRQLTFGVVLEGCKDVPVVVTGYSTASKTECNGSNRQAKNFAQRIWIPECGWVPSSVTNILIRTQHVPLEIVLTVSLMKPDALSTLGRNPSFDEYVSRTISSGLMYEVGKLQPF